jgi:uncharacterized protein YbaP (TraB family)
MAVLAVVVCLAPMLSGERDLHMIWEIRRRGRRSHLVGTAHLFPYHFRGALRRLVQGARAVLTEGPLDEASMRKVREAGSGVANGSLYHALDARARQRLCHALGLPVVPLEAQQLLLQALFGRPEKWLEGELRGLKPWMAFLSLWGRFQARLESPYSVDLDALRAASQLGKRVQHLETIDEQIAALDAVPLRRIVAFIAETDWHAYREDYVRRYLSGDLEGLMSAARAFPTFCEAVIERRDPVLAERLLSAVDAGGACAFIGITHVPGVIARLRASGCDVYQSSERPAAWSSTRSNSAGD